MPTTDPPAPTPAKPTSGPRTYKVFRRAPILEVLAEVLEAAGKPLTAEQQTALKGQSTIVYRPIDTLKARSPEAAMQAKADELQIAGVKLASCAENRWVEKTGEENIERSYKLV